MWQQSLQQHNSSLYHEKSLYSNIPNNEGIKASIGMLEKDADHNNNTSEMTHKN